MCQVPRVRVMSDALCAAAAFGRKDSGNSAKFCWGRWPDDFPLRSGQEERSDLHALHGPLLLNFAAKVHLALS